MANQRRNGEVEVRANSETSVGHIARFLSSIYMHRATLIILGGGAFGGIFDVLTHRTAASPSPWQVLFYAMIGTMAAVVLVAAADSRRRDLVKLLAISFVAGFSWEGVLDDAKHRLVRENNETNERPTVEAIKKDDQQDETASSDGSLAAESRGQELERSEQLMTWADALAVDAEASALLQNLATADDGYQNDEAESTLVDLGLIDDRYVLDRPIVTPLGDEIARFLQMIASSLPTRPDSVRETQVAAIGDTIAGEFAQFSDEWYSVEIAVDDRYVIETLGGDFDESVDTKLVLFDADFRPLSADDDCGPGTLSRIAQTLPGGSYLIQVSSYFATPGAYRLVIDQRNAAGPPCEVVQDPRVSTNRSAADTLDAGDTVIGTFDEGEGDHLYTLQVVEQGFVAISTSGSTMGLDTVVRLYDAGGDILLGYDDDGGERPRDSTLMRFLERGVYNIRVSSYAGRTGSYELSVQRR